MFYLVEIFLKVGFKAWQSAKNSYPVKCKTFRNIFSHISSVRARKHAYFYSGFHRISQRCCCKSASIKRFYLNARFLICKKQIFLDICLGTNTLTHFQYEVNTCASNSFQICQLKQNKYLQKKRTANTKIFE